MLIQSTGKEWRKATDTLERNPTGTERATMYRLEVSRGGFNSFQGFFDGVAAEVV